MALTTFLVILTLSLGITSVMLVVAARVSSPNRGSSAAVPANATVLQAWLAIALRPSRRNIAAWARARSGMNRWRVFFVWLLVAAIISGVEYYVLPLLVLPFGIHFSPTTWP